MQLAERSQHEEAFESAPIGLLLADPNGRIALVNRRVEVTFGYSRNELVGKPLASILSPDFRDTGAERPADGSEFRPVELVVRRKDGLMFPAEVVTSTSPGGEAVLVVRDLGEVKREEAALRARARQQGLVAELGRRALTGIGLDELMAEAVTLVASELGVEYANLLELLPDGTANFRAGVGWQAGMVGGMTAELAADNPAGQVVRDQTPVLIEDLRTDPRFTVPSVVREHGVVSSLTVPLYGQERPLGVLGVHSARPRRFPEADVHFVQAVANVVATAVERHHDEERLRERQMVRAEQMAAIGQVAAGVAHELRNPLTSIKGLVQVNLREAAARGLPADDLRVIEHEIRRMERTLQTFLDFARPPRPDRRRLDLADMVDRVYTLVGGRARKQGVELRFDRSEGAVGLDGDQDQLQQLILNLVLNALDAMPYGGVVEVELRAPLVGHVELLVRDTGPGIAPHILPKVFETFVSSKETGIGLGLPLSRRIAEDHGGSLSAYNLPAGGACFALRLPSA